MSTAALALLNLDGSESKTRMSGVTKAAWEDRVVIVTRQNSGGNEIEQRCVLSMDGDDLVLELPGPVLLQGGEPTVVRLVFKKSSP